MMKTYSYEECMCCIPKCDQELLIQNMRVTGNLNIVMNLSFFSVAELINEHSLWEDTPQGFDYWSARSVSSTNLTNGYLLLTKLTFEDKLEELSI